MRKWRELDEATIHNLAKKRGGKYHNHPLHDVAQKCQVGGKERQDGLHPCGIQQRKEKSRQENNYEY